MEYLQRFWAKVDKQGTDDCWPWVAGRTGAKGYGAFYAGRMFKAHRFAYQSFVGEIPEGMVVDHTCFNRLCQNPKHLRLLTPVENSLRANRVPITHCKRGHEFTPDNTKLHSKTRARVCRTCDRINKRKWKLEQRTQVA